MDRTIARYPDILEVFYGLNLVIKVSQRLEMHIDVPLTLQMMQKRDDIANWKSLKFPK